MIVTQVSKPKAWERHSEIVVQYFPDLPASKNNIGHREFEVFSLVALI